MNANPGARTWEMLRQQARAGGHDVQAVATNYVIERFIARLMAGNQNSAISIKGGQSLGILFGNQMRPTKDLDLNVEMSADEEDREKLIVTAIETACELEVDDGVTFDVSNIKYEWRKHQGTGGLRVSVPASINTSRVPFLIDIGIGNEMTFDPMKMAVPGILNGRKSAPPPIEAVIYPMENTLAEKLVSKFEDGAASIRHKDFFDLWLLIETLRRIGDFAVLDANTTTDERNEALRTEFRERLADGSLLDMPEVAISEDCLGRLSLALARTAAHRGAPIPDDVCQFLMNEFAEDSVQPKQWANWMKNNASRLKYRPPMEKGKDSLKSLIGGIGPFLEGVAGPARDYGTSRPVSPS